MSSNSYAIVQAAIEKQVSRHGGLRAAARAMEIDAGYLCKLRTGDKKAPDDAILRKLGLRRIVSYIEIGR